MKTGDAGYREAFKSHRFDCGHHIREKGVLVFVCEIINYWMTMCDQRDCVLRKCGLNVFIFFPLSLRIQWARSWSRAAFRFMFEICVFGPTQTRPWRVQSLGSPWIWINPSTPRYLPILIFKYHYFSPSEPNKILIWHRFSFPQFSPFHEKL